MPDSYQSDRTPLLASSSPARAFAPLPTEPVEPIVVIVAMGDHKFKRMTVWSAQQRDSRVNRVHRRN